MLECGSQVSRDMISFFFKNESLSTSQDMVLHAISNRDSAPPLKPRNDVKNTAKLSAIRP
jgi:hypothetical protein